jgi:hypothetical protein
MRLIFVLTAVLLSCVPASADGESWFAATAGSTEVYSNASADAAARVLTELEAAAAMFTQLVHATVPHPIKAFALKDEGSLRGVAPQYWERRGVRPHAIAYAGPHTAFLAMREDIDHDVRRVALLHEYVHLLTAHRAPDAPAWLNEGLAEFWGSVIVEDDHIVIGRAVKKHVNKLGRWMPIQQTLRQGRGEMDSSREQAAMFYAQSWAMVHYLLLGPGAQEPLAFMPSANLPGDFEGTLQRYVSNGKFREVIVRVGAGPFPRRVSAKISDARSLAERANMLVFGVRPQAALPLAREALAFDPREPLALEVMGTYDFLHNRPESARQWLSRATDQGPSSYGTAIYLALLSSSAADREQYLSIALGLRPDLEAPWQHLFAIYQQDGRLALMRRWCGALSRLSFWPLAAESRWCS